MRTLVIRLTYTESNIGGPFGGRADLRRVESNQVRVRIRWLFPMGAVGSRVS
jgi:hypothetical protein